MPHLTVIVASDGNNVQLAQHVATEAEALGHSVSTVQLNAFDLPLFNLQRDAGSPPTGLQGLKQALGEGDAWVVLAPEYNGSMPPTLNNAIAWLSRDGDDFRAMFRNRPVALGTHSGGGGPHVVMAMRMQFAYLGCNVIGRSLVVNKHKPVNPDSIRDMLSSLIQGLAA
jgi:chromate reductase